MNNYMLQSLFMSNPALRRWAFQRLVFLFPTLCILAALFLAAVLNHGFPVIFHCFLLRIELGLLWCHEFFLVFYMHTLSPTTQLKSLIRVVPVTANACEHVVMEL